jgi:hypothetical protein
MKPPFFLWRSGVLDAFDTIDEIEQRYAADALAEPDCALYDSSGRVLKAIARPKGTTRVTYDEQEPLPSDNLAELLRGYLQRGGTLPETVASLTLPELIQNVYPSRGTRARLVREARRNIRSGRSRGDADSHLGHERLFRAFAVAVLAGALAACVAFWLAMVYYRSLPPAPGFGQIREALIGLFEATIAGAVLIGMGVLFGAILRLELIGRETAKSIGWTTVALIGILVFIGVGVSIALTLLCGLFQRP